MSSSGITESETAAGGGTLTARIKARVQERLARRSSIAWIALLGALMCAPSIGTGLVADDYLHAALLEHKPTFIPARNPLDLFRFADGIAEHGQATIDAGNFSWSVSPTVRFSFWRPLSALTQWLDYQLWPGAPWLMHVHSLVWFGLALLAVGAVYRRMLGPTWVAGFALLLFAIDDAHGTAVGWLANRNAIVAVALAAPVLLVHDRWRKDGWAPGAWLGPVLLSVALLAGEPALGICAYLAGYAWHIDRAPTRERFMTLVPYGAVVVLWRVVYARLGYGVSGSGLYLDPARTPLAYLAAVPKRLPVLLLGQLGLPWSDVEPLYEYIAPWLPAVALFIAILALAFLAWALTPLLKRDPVARFFATGMVLAALPVCATIPSDRLLVLVGIGAMGLVAQLFATFEGKVQTLAVVYFTFAHLVVSPLMLPSRSKGMEVLAAQVALADDTIPKTPDVVGKTVVLVNPPDDLFGVFLLPMRTVLGIPCPARFRIVASSTNPVEIARVDARTLRVHPGHGFLEHDSSRMLRSPDEPFRAGEVVRIAGLAVTVESVTPDGRPDVATFAFDKPLEDSELRWLAWTDEGYAPWTPPPVGQTVTMPAHDFIAAAKFALKRAGR
jgi:hypothetical protein